VFADWVRSTGNGRIEFFDIGGDPKELMAWMVKSRSAFLFVHRGSASETQDQAVLAQQTRA
jgi:hypothetical protein